MQRRLEIWHANLQKKKSRWLLAPFGWLFGGVVRVRNFLYDTKWLRENRVRPFVVSVGNLVAGGVGKTPLVEKMASALLTDLQVSVLSRGYRGAAEKGKVPLTVDVQKQSPELCGDEPWLLASHLPTAEVIVCK